MSERWVLIISKRRGISILLPFFVKELLNRLSGYPEYLFLLYICSMEEIWKYVVGYEGLYEVSSLGRVKNYKTKKILKMKLGNRGYYEVVLYGKDKKKYTTVHQLVAQAFVEKPTYNAPCVNHINSVRNDNRVENLEWCNHSLNMRHGFLSGKKNQKGELNNYAKINMKIAIEIREYYKSNPHLSKKEVAEYFNITLSIAKDVLSFRSWNY